MFSTLWKILFFINSFLLVIKCNLVVIKFDRIKDIYSDDDEEVSLNILKNDIYCNMTVGNQLVPFYISFDKELTYIIDSNYTYSKYNSKYSKTFSQKSKELNSYVFEYLQYGFSVSDTFYLYNEENEKITITDMPFILGTYMNPKSDFNFPAQLGLKKKTYQNPRIFNFIENLKLKNIINSQVFFFRFNEEGGGELFIGSYPHEFIQGYDAKNLIQSSSLEMGTSNNWFLKCKYFFYGDNKTDIEKQTIELSPERGMIVLNLQMEKIFFDSFFKKLIDEKKCIRVIIQFNYNYICIDAININDLKNITFRHIGMEYDFILEPKDLFYHYYDRYFFLISFRDSFYIYLGKPFFKKFNLIFNQDSKQIAIYKYFETIDKNIQKFNYIFPTILIIIFTILVCIFIYCLHVYRLKKRRKNEIIENCDYTPQYKPNKEKDTKLLLEIKIS